MTLGNMRELGVRGLHVQRVQTEVDPFKAEE
jgi:hypothetical protein